MRLTAWGRQQEVELPPYIPIVVDEASIPPHLHRVIVDFSLTVLHRISIRAYIGVAFLAKQENGIAKQEDFSNQGKRSFLVVPYPLDRDPEMRRRREEEDSVKAKSQWLERSTGTGLGCWI